MATEAHSHWKAKVDGAVLEIVIGEDTTGQGLPRLVTRGIVTQAGKLIDKPLSPQFVERWEAGEEHARSLVDKVDEDGKSIGASAPDHEDAADLASANAQLAEAQAGEAKAHEAAVEQQERADAAETRAEALQTEIDGLQARVDELDVQASAEAPAETLTQDDVGNLKGKELDEALAERGLLEGHKSKSVDEKHLLLSGYVAARTPAQG